MIEEEDEDVVIPPRPGVKVYENPKGMVVVTNFADALRDPQELEMSYVLIHPEDAELVAQAITALAAQLKRREMFGG